MRFEIGQATGCAVVLERSVLGAREKVAPVCSEHEDVFEPIVLEIADQDLGWLGCWRDRRQ